MLVPLVQLCVEQAGVSITVVLAGKYFNLPKITAKYLQKVLSKLFSFFFPRHWGDINVC